MTDERISSHPDSGLESRLQQKIEQRRRNGTLRAVLAAPTLASVSVSVSGEGEGEGLGSLVQEKIDFCSNDYLGLARCPKQLSLVERSFRCYLDSNKTNRSPQNNSSNTNNEIVKLGSTGSRLLSGNAALPRSIEAKLARLHNRPDALLFNSGYDANLSLLSSVPIRGDIVIMDELVHNSLTMGVRMSRLHDNGANGGVLTFRHNDVADLRTKLIDRQRHNDHHDAAVSHDRPSVIIVVESVYSMDGDIAPLAAILDLALEFGASVVVDEAHGLGVYGEGNARDLVLPERQPPRRRGRIPRRGGNTVDDGDNPGGTASPTVASEGGGGMGVLAALGLETHPAILAVVYTFGKAAGCHGAVITASATVVQYLVNYARPFVYSTSLPPHSLFTIQRAYETMVGSDGDIRREKLFGIVRLFRMQFLRLLSEGGTHFISPCLLPSPTPIQAVLIPGNERCMKLAEDMRNEGHFDVYPIRSPTVPKGAERIRIIIHYHNEPEEILNLVRFLVTALKNYTPNLLESSSVDQGTQRSKL